VTPPADLTASLAYEQACGRLQRQVARLGESRSMASYLLAATGVVASLLGGKVLDKQDLELIATVLVVSAGVTFALGLMCGVRILRPIHDKEPTEIGALPSLELVGQEPRVQWRGNVSVAHLLCLAEKHQTRLSTWPWLVRLSSARVGIRTSSTSD
jgi:hypothetical protein